MRSFPHKKAQSLLEHAVFFSVIISALLLIGLYVRNTLSGKARETADTVLGQGLIYAPFGETQQSFIIENRGQE